MLTSRDLLGYIICYHMSISNLIQVYHKCSSMKPCRHGAECEAVDWIYQRNCTGTDHYGPMCETGTNIWD